MKKVIFYCVLILAGVLMFVSAPYMFIASEKAWIQVYATIDLILSIVSITIGVIGSIKSIRQE